MELKGKTAVVTGAGTGVGRELALAFAGAGARVVCCGRRPQPLAETASLAAARGAKALAVPTDVTDRASVRAAMEKALAEFGSIDLLFADAGSFRSIGPVWSADPEAWWQDVTTNLLGTMLCCREALPHMMSRNSGVIITMDGGGGADGFNLGGSGYGASKAAVVRFTEGLARELERVHSNVLTFCMNPGFVRTAMTEGIAAHPLGSEWQGFVGTWIREGRSVPPDACAKATMRLLAIAGPELSGRAFMVDTDFDEIGRTAARIHSEDLHVMRLRRLP